MPFWFQTFQISFGKVFLSSCVNFEYEIAVCPLHNATFDKSDTGILVRYTMADLVEGQNPKLKKSKFWMVMEFWKIFLFSPISLKIGSFIVQDKYICVIFEFSDFAQQWWKKIRFKFEI